MAPNPTTVPTSAVPTGPALPIALDLAEAGKAVYSRSCSGCHSSAASLAARAAGRGNAQALYDYVRKNMPQGRPGSLSEDEYLSILALLLVEGKSVATDTPIDATNLAAIALNK